MQCGMCGSTGIADQSHSESLSTEYDFCSCQIGGALDKEFDGDLDKALEFLVSKIEDQENQYDSNDIGQA